MYNRGMYIYNIKFVKDAFGRKRDKVSNEA